MSSRPTRSAKLAAAQKIAKILMEEDSDNDDIIMTPMIADKSSAEDLSVTSAHTTTPTPVNTPVLTATPAPKPKTPSFSELAESNPIPDLNAFAAYKATLKPIIIDKIKRYLNDCDSNSSKRYYAIPELMKYLISAPSIMIYHPKFRTTVEAKMTEFEDHIATNTTIGSYVITDKYRAEFKALATIVKSIAKIYDYVTLDSKFINNIDKIASGLTAAITALNNTMNTN
jgi:hypothetical protein